MRFEIHIDNESSTDEVRMAVDMLLARLGRDKAEERHVDPFALFTPGTAAHKIVGRLMEGPATPKQLFDAGIVKGMRGLGVVRFINRRFLEETGTEPLVIERSKGVISSLRLNGRASNEPAAS